VGPAVGASGYGGNYNFLKNGHRDNHMSGIGDYRGRCRSENQNNS
jgi:hypothetical protein